MNEDPRRFPRRKPICRRQGMLESQLRSLRISRQITQPMLARMLGCTYIHYQRMECGTHPFKLHQLAILAELYGESADEFADLQTADQILRLLDYDYNEERAARIIEQLYKFAFPYDDSVI